METGSMEVANIQDLAHRFKAISKRIQNLYRQQPGTPLDGHSDGTHNANIQQLCGLYGELCERQLVEVAMLLFVEHDLRIAAVLGQHPMDKREKHLHQVRSRIMSRVDTAMGSPSTDDNPPTR